MKLEEKMVTVVRDQSGIYPTGFDLLRLGPVIGWSFDRKTAERFAARQKCPTHVTDDYSEILTLDDGTVCRIESMPPLDTEDEKKAALDSLLSRLTPEERELLKGASS